MNYYSLLSFFASIFYAGLGIWVFSANKKGTPNRLFLFLSSCLFFWSFGNTFIYPETNRKMLEIWVRVAAPGWCIFPSLAIHFALLLTKRVRFKSFHIMYLFIYFPACFFTILAFLGKITPIDFINIAGNTYEIRNHNSLLGILYLFYNFSFMVTTLLICLIWRTKYANLVEKKRSYSL